MEIPGVPTCKLSQCRSPWCRASHGGACAGQPSPDNGGDDHNGAGAGHDDGEGDSTDHPLVGDHVSNVGNDIVSSAAVVGGGWREEEAGGRWSESKIKINEAIFQSVGDLRRSSTVIFTIRRRPRLIGNVQGLLDLWFWLLTFNLWFWHFWSWDLGQECCHEEFSAFDWGPPWHSIDH